MELIVKERNANRQVVINPQLLIGVRTNSLYVRKGFTNGTLFLSQKGNGNTGAGDVCPLHQGEVTVSSGLYERILIYSEKANAQLVEIV